MSLVGIKQAWTLRTVYQLFDLDRHGERDGRSRNEIEPLCSDVELPC